MNNWHLLDDDAQKAVISKWSLEKRAKNGRLDEYLSLKEICDLLYPMQPWPIISEYPKRADYREAKKDYNEAKDSHDKYLEQLINACKSGLLLYEGDINAKIWRESLYIPDTVSSGKYVSNASSCTTNNVQFKAYLLSTDKWPVGGLLTNWWPNDEPQAEDMKEVENKGERNQVHSVQADDKKASGQYGLAGNDGASGNKKATRKRTTKLNGWLRERWDEWGKPNARDFAAKLKPLQGMINSPVKKYHGWIPRPGVVVDWYEAWGATSWGCRTFENKVDDFKREDKEAEKNSCQ